MKKLLFGLTLLASFFMAAPALAYTVEKGDTMSRIARDHNLTLKELATANPHIKDLDYILVGQTVHTPGTVSVASAVSNTSSETKTRNNKPEMNDIKSGEVNFSEAEIDLLARIVRAEAQTQPFEGKVAVADVVLNRVESSQFPDSVREVIYAPGQFQPVKNGEINRPADEESKEAVYVALAEDNSITDESLFFYNPDIATSRWLDTRETTVVIGDHVFKR